MNFQNFLRVSEIFISAYRLNYYQMSDNFPIFLPFLSFFLYFAKLRMTFSASFMTILYMNEVGISETPKSKGFTSVNFAQVTMHFSS